VKGIQKVRIHYQHRSIDGDLGYKINFHRFFRNDFNLFRLSVGGLFFFNDFHHKFEGAALFSLLI
jgi:hypothetical protein